ncbi:endonuclease III [Candidatus Micrarchaeota archaeon]|nr:endonuclease III [Candidatus Micrarchaeota archaeon]
MITNKNIGNVLEKVKFAIHNNTTEVEKLDTPFKILIGTVLSARTKDETTGKTVDRLFSKVDSPKKLSNMKVEQVEKLIYPVGFYKTKAKNIVKLSKILVKEYNSEVPDTITELVKLPGVGRKTANLVLSLAFDKDAICVDTHVHRITNRWGYVNTKTPYETEMVLRKKLPRKYWKVINSLLVRFGQNICRPVRPKCSECPLKNVCEYYKKRWKLKQG